MWSSAIHIAGARGCLIGFGEGLPSQYVMYYPSSDVQDWCLIPQLSGSEGASVHWAQSCNCSDQSTVELVSIQGTCLGKYISEIHIVLL
jgi:hypothetical protein